LLPAPVGLNPPSRGAESEKSAQRLEFLLLRGGLERPRGAERTQSLDVELLQSSPARRYSERQELLLEELAVLAD
jgi:hypothetical protein